MYEGQETYGKLAAEAAERKLRDETYGKGAVDTAGIKSEEQIMEDIIIEQVKAYKEASFQLTLAQFVERIIILNK